MDSAVKQIKNIRCSKLSQNSQKNLFVCVCGGGGGRDKNSGKCLWKDWLNIGGKLSDKF